MIVCVCRRVTDHQIRQAAAEGADSLECLQMELGVALQCGRCADCASHVLCEARGASRPRHVSVHAGTVPIGIARAVSQRGA